MEISAKLLSTLTQKDAAMMFSILRLISPQFCLLFIQVAKSSVCTEKPESEKTMLISTEHGDVSYSALCRATDSTAVFL